MAYEQRYSQFSKSIRSRKVAAVQMNVAFANVGSNLQKIVRHLGNLAKHDVDLVLFPEAALTGYCFDSLEAALEVAIDVRVPGGALDRIQSACEELKITAIIGFAERQDGVLYNSAAIMEPGEPKRIYRKTHLPFLGMDRFATAGDELVIWETSIGKIAPLICFDLRFPEAARTLSLEGAENSAEHVAVARAYENKVFVFTCNRVGSENGFRFIGKSKLIHASGKVLAAAEAFEVVLISEVDPGEAVNKRVVNIPGSYEVDLVNSRRTNLYRL